MDKLRSHAWFVFGTLVCVELPVLIAIGVENGMAGKPFNDDKVLVVAFLGVVTGLGLALLSALREKR